MNREDTLAVIWDMDGVIADTALYHMQAWQETLLRRGIEYTKDDFKMGFGQRNEEIIGRILGQGVSQDEIDAIAVEKEKNFRRRLGQDLKPLPGVIKLMRALAESGFKMALASSTPMENIRLLNKSLGIAEYFEAIVSANDVTEGKPSPQGFLMAARKLNVDPGNCLVIEDAIAGITAAKRAGMFCLAVTNTNPRESLRDADLIIDTLEDVSVDDIMAMLRHSYSRD